MITTSETIAAIAAALAKAQAEMTGAVRDRKNPHFKSEYATLASAVAAARGPLTANHISFVQMPGALTPEGIPVTTRLMHGSGEWIEGTLVMPVTKRDPQGMGSAITYACRYAFMAALGLPPVDDDGEAAMDRSAPPSKAPPRDDPFAPGAEEIADTIRAALMKVESRADFDAWKADHSADMKSLPDELFDAIKADAQAVAARFPRPAPAQREAA